MERDHPFNSANRWGAYSQFYGIMASLHRHPGRLGADQPYPHQLPDPQAKLK